MPVTSLSTPTYPNPSTRSAILRSALPATHGVGPARRVSAPGWTRASFSGQTDERATPPRLSPSAKPAATTARRLLDRAVDVVLRPCRRIPRHLRPRSRAGCVASRCHLSHRDGATTRQRPQSRILRVPQHALQRFSPRIAQPAVKRMGCRRVRSASRPKLKTAGSLAMTAPCTIRVTGGSGVTLWMTRSAPSSNGR